MTARGRNRRILTSSHDEGWVLKKKFGSWFGETSRVVVGICRRIDGLRMKLLADGGDEAISTGLDAPRFCCNH